MNIGGFIPTSTIDFPGRLAAVIFTQGCPWRCHYCHNPILALGQVESPHDWEGVKAMLEQRKALLDGVVISGGEPLIQKDLVEVLKQIKGMGFEAALHTGGAMVNRFKETLPYLDWVGYDIKAEQLAYVSITQVEDSGVAAFSSLQVLLDSGVDYEVRTTVHWGLMSREELLSLSETLADLGVKNYVVQIARDGGTLSKELLAHNGSASEFEAGPLAEINAMFEKFSVRPAG
ncbi:MAG: anaerobic ribonucleoside-triphosphate reductase activating protein [Gammaproteobacteria bacterium]|nr:MAG: anaerobic ribonucleoside-triphosphate reductase activating protein [Gammaproteobacteria bacterium]